MALSILLSLAVLGVAVWLIESLLPMAQPFRVLIRLVAVLVAIWMLVRLVALVAPPFPS